MVADIFNLFNRQAINAYDERYNLQQDGDACAGIPSNICGSAGGLAHLPNSIEPAGVIPNPRATATNPDYLKKGIGFTDPRSIRLGVRFTF